ncbi:SAM-dependent methyltransferase [candidate division WOR-1 bacterium RIFOXYC2_FULL_37_10]|uniref:SAM-dependent methyltransferase n=1 Tax=candidate division WOR-1 bacterium RIFOXYB2_FULL_37_13 TaxID=1802579 RepID=A0A1F4SQC7_UNCSA|nr:MAG: SAM-dependent methyltransferase [candidate division WOR-1 bacterium RIFOXYA2_FULL_37_7]OGC22635.1 MAG: SAM-dependent methyltransferase [candidate division WOR-1 bacterium RIFOXYB2_FULL_37_13]OGC36281.1 MAG: SAM-dependent methyltransferase [candidate division WOR-1 bacterium RIFOXYC2_FULL_37_10]
MGKLLNIITNIHQKTKRDVLARMLDDKVKCMGIARKFGSDFWDGDRRFGYGGYKYDGRWGTVAKQLVETYKLPSDAKILDVGCGKGFLLYEFKKILPNAEVVGFDISKYAIEHAKDEVKSNLFVHKAQSLYPFKDKKFDLVVSVTTLHNLCLPELKIALQEIERVAKNKYILVEGYRSEEELFNLQCWALTCESFLRPEEWVWFFNEYGYSGDYEFIYF